MRRQQQARQARAKRPWPRRDAGAAQPTPMAVRYPHQLHRHLRQRHRTQRHAQAQERAPRQLSPHARLSCAWACQPAACCVALAPQPAWKALVFVRYSITSASRSCSRICQSAWQQAAQCTRASSIRCRCRAEHAANSSCACHPLCSMADKLCDVCGKPATQVCASCKAVRVSPARAAAPPRFPPSCGPSNALARAHA
jgi:hypothetical protein